MNKLHKILLMIFVIIVNSCSQVNQKNQKSGNSGRIEILFLGHDSEHHHSEKYAPMLAAALLQRGINISYTANPDDLNNENLALYDVLIIYANS